MLSNLESQLKQQGASDKIDAVLAELPLVQKDVGYVPLVTPTSQIVGTQAVFNVLFGRYERMTGEFCDLLTGKYGKVPAEPNKDLVKKALEQNKMEEAITCRPADKIEPEWDKMVEEAKANGGNGSVEDVLTYAMFPKVATKFFETRANGPVDAEKTFGLKEAPKAAASANGGQNGAYTVTVNGTSYNVQANGDNITVDGTTYNVAFGAPSAAPAAAAATVTGGEDVKAPVAGTLLKQCLSNGAKVTKGQTVIIIESMKMELEVKSRLTARLTTAFRLALRLLLARCSQASVAW
jgi:oxaloacetate decarboxylase alpha subunit